jgi:hypothetical protein
MSFEVPRGGAQTRNLNSCINVLHLYRRKESPNMVLVLETATICVYYLTDMETTLLCFELCSITCCNLMNDLCRNQQAAACVGSVCCK